MRPIDLSVLQEAAHEICGVLRAMTEMEVGAKIRIMTTPEEKLDPELQGKGHGEYHGFGKYRFDKEFLATIKALNDTDLSKIQAELVIVNRDLSDEIHHHKIADAYVTALGEAEHFQHAHNAEGFCGWDEDASWEPFKTGQALIIPKGMPHGFRVHDGGILYFLSVQSPPISGEGYDDYHHR